MRHQLRAVASVLVLLVAAPGCDSSINVRMPELPTVPDPPVIPSGSLVTEPRPISGVGGVSLAAVGLVEIGFGASESLVITAPESVMPLLGSSVVGGLLVLDRASASYQGQTSDIRYDLVLQRLEELYLRGVGEIRAEGIDETRLLVQLTGVGDIRAAGRVDRQEVTVSGVGDYLAARLESRVAQVTVTGGKARIWATERIEGYVGVGCLLEYLGNPTLQVEGPGTVQQLDLSP